MNKYACGTPKQHCNGSLSTHIHRLRGTTVDKVHSSSLEAFKCYRHYLITVLGYTQIGGREFAPPDDSPILVLTKKIRFGGKFRQGKRETGQKRGTRLVPKDRLGGVMISI